MKSKSDIKSGVDTNENITLCIPQMFVSQMFVSQMFVSQMFVSQMFVSQMFVSQMFVSVSYRNCFHRVNSKGDIFKSGVASSENINLCFSRVERNFDNHWNKQLFCFFNALKEFSESAEV